MDPNSPPRVPPTTAVRCFSAAQEGGKGRGEAVGVELGAAVGVVVGEEVGDEEEGAEEDEGEGVGSWMEPRKEVVREGAAGSAQQEVESFAGRQQYVPGEQD